MKSEARRKKKKLSITLTLPRLVSSLSIGIFIKTPFHGFPQESSAITSGMEARKRVVRDVIATSARRFAGGLESELRGKVEKSKKQRRRQRERGGKRRRWRKSALADRQEIRLVLPRSWTVVSTGLKVRSAISCQAESKGFPLLLPLRWLQLWNVQRLYYKIFY